MLVTGSSKGIGYAIVKKLAHDIPNSTFYVTSRSLDDAKKAVKQLEAEFEGIQAIPLELDVQKETSIESLVTTVPIIDILINNAGIMFNGRLVNDEIITSTLSTNFYGQKSITEKLISASKLSKKSKIIFVSSKLGMITKVEKNNKTAGAKLRAYQNTKDGQPQTAMTADDLKAIVDEYLTDIKDAAKKKLWPTSVYAMSKMFLTVYAFLLSRSEEIRDIEAQVYSCCPGWCQTDLTKGSNAPKTANEGAVTPCMLACLPEQIDVWMQGQFVSEGKVTQI